jgi:hypothetical protein
MSLKLRRGTNAERLAFTPDQGELVYTNDTKQLYAGDGVTPGGTLVSYNGSLEGPLGGDLILTGHDITGSGNINITGTITSTGNITTQGNVVVQGNVTLGNDGGDNIAISGEINSNIIPNLNNSFNLGAEEKRWDTIYANNVFAELEGNVRALDSTILVDAVGGVLRGQLQGSVSNPGETAVQGNVIGNVEGNLTGSVKAPNDIVIVDAGTDGTDAVFYGTFVGTLDGAVQDTVLTTGTYTNPSWIATLDADKIFGTLTNVYLNGDMEGSVFADDSTLLVDGVNGVLRGTHIGDVEGNVRGTIDTGAMLITGSTILSDTNQRITLVTQASGYVDIPGRIDVANLRVVNDPITGGIEIVTNTNTSQPISIFAAHDNASSTSGEGAGIVLARARGTVTLPTPLQASDEIHRITFAGIHNAGPGEAANIVARAVAVSTHLEGKLEFSVTNSSGVNGVRLAVDGNGVVTINAPTLVAGANPGDVDVSVVATYIKVNINGIEYAIPAYAIR